MSDTEVNIRENYLNMAVSSITACNRYWSPLISRGENEIFSDLLKESGLDVTTWELPPENETVFFIASTYDFQESLKNIAIKRAEKSLLDCDSDLPV